jgi:hypothetical protein
MIKDSIRIKCYKGTWYVIDRTTRNNKEYFLLESEIWGDDVPCIIVDENNKVVMDDVHNGFTDFDEMLGY